MKLNLPPPKALTNEVALLIAATYFGVHAQYVAMTLCLILFFLV